MKKRFSEEQIIRILAEAEHGNDSSHQYSAIESHTK